MCSSGTPGPVLRAFSLNLNMGEASMDENNNGMISYDELLKGYDEVGEFKRFMDLMDLKREDMATVFNVLDTKNTQEVPYLELCRHLGNFFKRDPVLMHSLVIAKAFGTRHFASHGAPVADVAAPAAGAGLG